MSYPKDIYNNLDAFVKGNLQGAELQEFEAALLHDPELAEKVENARFLQKLVFKNRLLTIKDLAKQEEARIGQKNQYIKKGIIGISLLTLILVTIGILQYNKKEDKVSIQSVESPGIAPEVISNSALGKSDLEKKTNPELPNAHSENNKILKSDNSGNPNAESYHVVVDTIQPKPTVDNASIKLEDSKSEDSKVISGSDAKVKDENTQPCGLVQLKTKISTTPACIGSTNGKIEAINISGGTKPYTQNLFLNGREVYSNSGLKAGNYELVITDSKSCEQRFTAQVSEISCPINDYFNPSFGEVWNIPVTDKAGKLTIYTKSGIPIYQMDLKRNTATTWNGIDKYERLEAGYFIFVIEYEDGEVLKGSVTITL
ncbi:MAG: SprB repeat-containing protein [Sporocytophaga sp.]|uniref:hypothetical protein n=1 Tax=Sporocytophaga sp. TaxID=2231183 RepID=UPI001B189601|nr:hypothetical protein [Sporocytophaga sp.]MBO9703595.1 SprB repeat-containing protein [Sporocytophaga sp.]